LRNSSGLSTVPVVSGAAHACRAVEKESISLLTKVAGPCLAPDKEPSSATQLMSSPGPGQMPPRQPAGKFDDERASDARSRGDSCDVADCRKQSSRMTAAAGIVVNR
jgi:hypothetical protein